MQEQSNDERRVHILRKFRATMQHIREARPRTSDIAKLRAAIARLLDVARGDTGQSAHVGNFLLAWWNAPECGGFDLTHLWNVDLKIAKDMGVVLSTLPNLRHYPDRPLLAFGEQFKDLVRLWRPDLGKAAWHPHNCTDKSRSSGCPLFSHVFAC
jgi:hypothetical protein